MTHDKFCIYEMAPHLPDSILKMSCSCERIATIRADEREQAAQRVDAVLDHRSWCASQPHSQLDCDCGKEIVIAAARGSEWTTCWITVVGVRRNHTASQTAIAARKSSSPQPEETHHES